MKEITLVLAVTCLIFTFPVPGRAQGDIELGMDFGFNVAFIDDDDQEIFTIGLPATDFSSTAQNIRVGFPLGARGRIEPSFGFSALDDGYATSLQMGLGLDYMFVLTSTRDKTIPFLRTGVISRIIRARRENSLQLGVTGGSGFRVMMGKNWGTRVEGGINRLFKSGGLPGRWDMTGSIGLSFMLE